MSRLGLNWFRRSSGGFHWQRHYRGPLQAVILDWSGTTADNWVIAPARAFVEVFAEFKVPITMEEAREPMGLLKSAHLKALLETPSIAKRWNKQYGRDPDPSTDLPKMMERFNPLQLACLPQYCKLIPGTASTVKTLRNKFGLKIGTTTGFMRPMVDILLTHAKKQGYEPDVNVAGDEVDYPRPFPYIVYANMYKLGILNADAVLKVDDTVGGIGEGLNGSTWTAALSHTSNYMTINRPDHGLSKEEFEARGQRSREILLKSGAHYVVRDINHLPHVVQDINRRLANGEKP
jgi:phosphonoacetaldehyde hydrolase